MKKFLLLLLLPIIFGLSGCSNQQTKTEPAEKTSQTSAKKVEFTVDQPQYSADNKTVIISGHATDGKKVQLKQDGTVLNEITVQDNNFTFSQPLSDTDTQTFEVVSGDQKKTVEAKPLNTIQSSSELIKGVQTTTEPASTATTSSSK